MLTLIMAVLIYLIYRQDKEGAMVMAVFLFFSMLLDLVIIVYVGGLLTAGAQ